jgi:hypothetical protein
MVRAVQLGAIPPERPRVSELQLDMGVRTESGGLELVPALLPPTADVAGGYLPLTSGGVLGQAFKFLVERYGWGHA